MVVCIGSDRISGDALGPIVGTILREKGVNCPVFGVEGQPINGMNVEAYREFFKRFYADSLVIAVDAAVGKPHEVGQILCRRGGIRAGGALGRDGDRIGDISLLGIVAEKEGEVLPSLLATPFHRVEEMAERIAGRLLRAIGTSREACNA